MTMTGALPPSSIASFFNPAERVIASPAAKPPVKDTMRTSLAITRALPTSTPPTTTVTISSGRPASMSALTRLMAERGGQFGGLEQEGVACSDGRTELVGYEV